MILPLQIISQVTESFLCSSIRSLLRVLDPMNATFDILVQPRLQEHTDRRLVRAKQYHEDLENFVLLLAPFACPSLDHSLLAQL